MKIIKFKECNITFAENQPEYLPLPAHKTGDGIVTSCWGLTFFERLRVVLLGKIYLQTMTFNKPLQPLKMSINKPIQVDGRTSELPNPPGPPDCPRPKNYHPVG